jgi:hypothetical protein
MRRTDCHLPNKDRARVIWLSKTSDCANDLLITHRNNRGIRPDMALQEIAVEAVFIEWRTLAHQLMQSFPVVGCGFAKDQLSRHIN